MGPKAGLEEEAAQRVSTGIAKLDLLLDGGFRKGRNILLIGPPGSEKTIFGMQFLNAALNSGKRAIYVTTDLAPSNIEAMSSKYGFDLASKTGKSLAFIDCYTWTLGGGSQGRNDTLVSGPAALNDLAIGIGQALAGAGDADKCAVVHSVSTLLLYNSPDTVFKFVQFTGARLKSANATTLFFLEDGMHDEKVVTTIKHLTDKVLVMRQEKERWTIETEDEDLPVPADFAVGPNGIELV
jgi:KaiC/GvpD/RAD55 family RecA-like ATPase